MATVVIDPGHYARYNPGTCPNYYEGDTMLKLAQYLGNDLMDMGANVKYTRTSGDQNPTLTQRGQMGAGADVFISLHTDASDNPAASGVTSFYSVRQPNAEPFATEIGQAVAGAMGNTFRGSQTRESQTSPGYDYYGVIRSAVAAGAKNVFLIEHGFHTNMKDCMTLSDDAALQRIAAAEARVIGQRLGLTAPSPAPSIPTTPTTPTAPVTPSMPSIPSMPSMPSMPAAGCRFSYLVQPGDSLYSIGQKFDVPWQDIAALNNIISPNNLTIGQRLRIPGSGASTNYTVKSGDSLSRIAQSYQVPWQDIAMANSLLPPYQLTIGQNLIIPQGCSFGYIVQPGDSLYNIGAKYGISWESIASANGLRSPYTISVGQKLLLPIPLA